MLRDIRSLANIAVVEIAKNSFAVNPMDDCPSDVDARQLEDLHLVIKYAEEKKN